MATEGGGQLDEDAGGAQETPPELPGEGGDEPASGPARVGEYTWDDFKREFYLDENGDPPTDWRGNIIEFDPAEYLGFPPAELHDRMDEGRQRASKADFFLDFISTPVTKDEYTWTHFKYEYYLTDAGELPTDGDDEVIPFDASEYLGFHSNKIEETLTEGAGTAATLRNIVDERTVNVDPDLEEDDFFSTFDGHTTVVNRYDLEKAVSIAKKRHFREIDRYWVNKPYSFVIIFRSEKENETKYYLVEPHHTAIEENLLEFLTGKLRSAIKYASSDVIAATSEEDRAAVIEQETMRLLDRYNLYLTDNSNNDYLEMIAGWVDTLEDGGFTGEVKARLRPLVEQPTIVDEDDGQLPGISARPEPAVLKENDETLTAYQVEKLLYVLTRDFIGYERIDGIKHDINVEDISCDGYESPIFVYHTDYEQIITNVFHGTNELDNFVVKLAQRSGKGISKRQPQVDATLPDGSRAQLTLGREVSDHGTNYTIRQFKDVPFTPIDLINWHTFNLEEMALLWLCIENHKSLIFAGGTASGKTTSLNAVSLFIPSNTKIVSIEDTREVELPQRNWIASVTRPSFVEDGAGDVDEFDLLEAALRQRPDYIVMGEIRGEEGRTLFQVMSTGHTTYTTFHADSVGEVLKRFTTEPINVSKTMFTALDLVSIQTQTRVQGTKVRRNKSLTEINHYDAENDEINVQDVFEWRAESDEFIDMGQSNTLEDIKFDRGWTEDDLQAEIFKRQVVLAYLIKEHLNEYAQVAATLQAFINDPDTILGLIATDHLEESLTDLREMESVLIDIDPEKEKMVPRPDPNDRAYKRACEILAEAEKRLFDRYRDAEPGSISTALKIRREERSERSERSEPAEEAMVTRTDREEESTTEYNSWPEDRSTTDSTDDSTDERYELDSTDDDQQKTEQADPPQEDTTSDGDVVLQESMEDEADSVEDETNSTESEEETTENETEPTEKEVTPVDEDVQPADGGGSTEKEAESGEDEEGLNDAESGEDEEGLNDTESDEDEPVQPERYVDPGVEEGGMGAEQERPGSRKSDSVEVITKAETSKEKPDQKRTIEETDSPPEPGKHDSDTGIDPSEEHSPETEAFEEPNAERAESIGEDTGDVENAGNAGNGGETFGGFKGVQLEDDTEEQSEEETEEEP